jgi:outer membrane protein assembly factor BamB
MNNSMPVWGADNVLFITSAYNGGSRALRLSKQDGRTRVEELWFTNRLRIMFGNAIRIGDYVYGSSGDLGPAFLTALNIKTGEVVWQERGFGRSSFVYADRKLIIMDEDGSLALARVSPKGLQVLSKANLFDTTSWTVPALAGKTLYARDRKKIVALDLSGK